MGEWAKAASHPLGLAGFALFLIFLWAANTKKVRERRWMVPLFVVAAFVALVGGVIIGFKNITKPQVPQNVQQGPSQQQANNVQQQSSGPGSPNVQGVQGDVTITNDQSTGSTSAQTAPAAKPPQKGK